jgi:hypothetical protein
LKTSRTQLKFKAFVAPGAQLNNAFGVVHAPGAQLINQVTNAPGQVLNAAPQTSNTGQLAGPQSSQPSPDPTRTETGTNFSTLELEFEPKIWNFK